jgi:thymidylate kinase
MQRVQRGRVKPFTVALVGPDGAGKTTVALRIGRELSHPARYLYMGVSAESARQLLPTTRLVRAIRRRRGRPAARTTVSTVTGQETALRSSITTLRSLLRLANMVAEESYRQLLIEWHLRHGRVVLLDRHFYFDYYATDVVRPRTLARKLHGLFLDRIYPKPDLVIYLDAPPEMLLARKGEGTLESLAQMRQDYLGIHRLVPRFEVVDGTLPLEEVTREVAAHIEAFPQTADQRIDE